MIAMESICTTENDSWIGRILKITYQKKNNKRKDPKNGETINDVPNVGKSTKRT